MPGEALLKIPEDEVLSIEPIGSCEAMQELFRCVDKVASTGVSILIRGERGSGKKLLGGMIHRKSKVSEGPFIIATEANLGETLGRWETIGKIEGSIPDAPERFDARGTSAAIHHGTLYIDEIGDLSLSSQKQLLRYVEENEPREKNQNAGPPLRLIASTSKDLEQLALDRVFRTDLFYRLNVVTLNLPPLRGRGADLMQLAAHFLGKYAREHHRNIDAFAPKAVKLMLTYEWPGNVRELAETIERAVLSTPSGVIEKSSLAIEPDLAAPEAGGLFKLMVSEYEKRLINDALARCKGKLNKAARLLRTSNRVIAYKVKKYAIDYLKYRH